MQTRKQSDELDYLFESNEYIFILFCICQDQYNFLFLVYFYLENNFFFFFINPRQSLYVFVPGERLIFIIFCWCNIYMYYKKIYTQYANQCFDKFRNLVK